LKALAGETTCLTNHLVKDLRKDSRMRFLIGVLKGRGLAEKGGGGKGIVATGVVKSPHTIKITPIKDRKGKNLKKKRNVAWEKGVEGHLTKSPLFRRGGGFRLEGGTKILTGTCGLR